MKRYILYESMPLCCCITYYSLLTCSCMADNHTQALTLLFTLSSQPRKLLMLATSRTAQRSRGFLCWKIAEAVALRLAELAGNKRKVLAPYAHLFLDHLHSIASATNDSGGAMDSGIGSYPSHVIDILCCTMVSLTKQERGVFSLLMITIQKQLVSRVGIFGVAQGSHLRTQICTSRTTAATHVKQLMALFLAGHLVKSQIALEERDRKSLVSWILRLLSTAASEEILLHAMKLVREGTTGPPSPFMKAVMSEEERSLCHSLVAQVFRKNSLIVSNRDEFLVRQRDTSDGVLAYDQVGSENPQRSADEASLPLVVNLTEFTRRMQAELNAISKSTSNDGSSKDGGPVVREDAVECECLMKLSVLRELYHSYVAFSSPKVQERILDGGFLFPSLYQSIITGRYVSSDVDPKALSSLIWSLVCGLDVAVTSANVIASHLAQATKEKQATMTSYQSRLACRLKICLELRGQLERAIVLQKAILQVRNEDKSSNQSEQDEIEWLLCQCAVAERLMSGQSRRAVGGVSPSASLNGIELRALCLFFEIQWKNRCEDALPLVHELQLLRVLSYHLRSDVGGDQAKLPTSADRETSDGGVDVSEIKRILLFSSEGRRTLKYLSARAGDLSQLVNAAGEDSASESDGELDDGVNLHKGIVKELATSGLLCIYSLFIQVLEHCGEPDDSTRTSGGTWDDKVMELFATGCNAEESASAADASGARGHLEVFYQFLLHECLKMKVRQLVIRWYYSWFLTQCACVTVVLIRILNSPAH